MGSRLVVTWECDRCGALHETDETTSPEGWKRLVHGPVRGGIGNLPGTMCVTCDEQFWTWWVSARIDGDDRG